MKTITPLILAIASASAAVAQAMPAPVPVAPVPAVAAPDKSAPINADPAGPALVAPVPASPVPVAPVAPVAPVKNIDPSTLSRLDRSASAYKALHGLQANFEQTIKQGSQTVVQTGTLKWKSPQSVRMEWKSGTSNLLIVSDGKDLYRYAVGRPQYLKTALQFNPAPAGIQGIEAANLEPFLSLLLSGANPLRDKVITAVPLTTKLMDPTKFGDEMFDGVQMIVPQGQGVFTITLWLDPATNLLRRVEGSVKSANEDVAIQMVYSGLQIDPQFAPDTFTFTPPKDVKEFVAPKPAPITESVSNDFDPRIKVGTVPYALSGPDLSGKPRSISGYKGKVLLVDFWATWCGPCIGEMPNVIKNYNKYHGRGFEILGVSLDENKAVLAKFVKTEKIDWPQLFDGKGWNSVYGAKYKVQAIPFSILVGKDGKIAAVNPRGLALETAIKKALAK